MSFKKLVENAETVVGYPFVVHVDQVARPELSPTILLSIYDSGYHSDLDNIMQTGGIKRMGYFYDFSHFLKKFVYKQYGSWQQAYAPNKTLLRKVVCGTIDQILEA